MVFDARRAKLLAPGEHIIVDAAPGLRLVASATRKTWTYRFKSPLDGRMRQVAIGQWPAMSYAAALGAWDDLKQQREAGQDPAMARKAEAAKVQAAARQTRAGVYTVARLTQDYLAGHVDRHRKPKGQAETRRLLENYLGDLVDVPAASVTRAQAFALLEELAKRAPVLASSLRAELGAAWDYALDAGRIPEETPNWWRLILRGKLRSKGKIVAGEHVGQGLRVLDAAEVGQLVRWLPNFSPLVTDLLTLYLWTGARGGEIVTMEGSEISQEADGWWWTLPKAKTKSARHAAATDLRVPLVGAALAVVRRRLDLYGRGWLFPVARGDAAHVEQKVVGVAVWATRATTVTAVLPKDRAKVLRLAPWAPHDLRRTVRTTLAALGCPDAVAEAVLGHMPAGIVGVYNRHSYDAERRHWLTLLSAHWDRLAAQP